MARKNSATYTRTCTKTGRVFTTTTLDENGKPDFSEHFYRDKSNSSGYSPWSKDAERAYNKAYSSGLKKAKVTRKRDISSPKMKNAFEREMSTERVQRKKHVNRTAKDATVNAKSAEMSQRNSTSKTRVNARTTAKKATTNRAKKSA